MARYFALLLVTSGLVSAVVHPLPNLTDMSGGERAAITLTCLIGGAVIWLLPWDRWPRSALLAIPPVGMLIKMWANTHGGLGPFSYSIHFCLIYVWMGVALPRGAPLAFAPLLGLTYAIPLLLRGDPRQTASLAMVLPICVVIGESVAWISNRLREVEQVDGQRMQRMHWLVTASSALAHESGEQELAELIASLANDLPGANGAAVLLLAPERVLTLAAAREWSRPLPDRFEISRHPALLEAVRSAENLGWQHPACVALAAELDVPRLAIAPLHGSSRCMGVVLVSRRVGASLFDEFTQDLVSTLLVQAALAVERIRDREALRDASLHDELTRLGNRRKANMRLEQLDPGDALALIDLDYFKRVNDEFGHAAGDRALRDVADYLVTTLREEDQAYRHGGEEFLVVLEKAGQGALLAAERLCGGWRLLDPVTTLSIGVAVHREGDTPEATLGRADAALYSAKAAGRDCVILG